MPGKEYEKALSEIYVELVKWQYWIKQKGLRVIIVFEGRDAAGKGGTIKRLMEPLNPRGCNVGRYHQTLIVGASCKTRERRSTYWKGL